MNCNFMIYVTRKEKHGSNICIPFGRTWRLFIQMDDTIFISFLREMRLLYVFVWSLYTTVIKNIELFDTTDICELFTWMISVKMNINRILGPRGYAYFREEIGLTLDNRKLITYTETTI